MNAHKRFSWLLIGSILIAAVFGVALSSPRTAAGQGQGTPTHLPPPPRTVPPGIRLTPTAEPEQATPQPPSTAKPPSGQPEATPNPTPAVLLPVSGGESGGGSSYGLELVILLGLGLVAAGLIVSRRVHAK